MEPRLRLVPPPTSPTKEKPGDRFMEGDHALVAGIKRGDRVAASALYHKYQGRVRRTLARVLGFDSELSDMVQETFIRALGSTRLIRDPQALPSWILRIAVCTATDLIRKRRHRRWLHLFTEPKEESDIAEAWGHSSEIDLEGRAALRATQAILDRMPAKERIAFTLRRFEGLELIEVADACDCSLATIKRRIACAEKRFLHHAEKYPELHPWLAGKEDDHGSA